MSNAILNLAGINKIYLDHKIFTSAPKKGRSRNVLNEKNKKKVMDILSKVNGLRTSDIVIRTGYCDSFVRTIVSCLKEAGLVNKQMVKDQGGRKHLLITLA